MNLFEKVERAVIAIDVPWTTVKKAQMMAAAIVALRPAVSMEIGVYCGTGLVTMGLAHAEIGYGTAVGIDPYSPHASAEGQTGEHLSWWQKLDHNKIYAQCLLNIDRFNVNNTVKLHRMTSDAFAPVEPIGLLRIDGNHSDQAIRDVERYASKVQVGGLVISDDIAWPGDGVKKSIESLYKLGFVKLYDLDDGAVFQRRVFPIVLDVVCPSCEGSGIHTYASETCQCGICLGRGKITKELSDLRKAGSSESMSMYALTLNVKQV